MRKSLLNIVTSFLLLAGLLVGQVAVNFFHNHHESNNSELASLKKSNPDSSYLSDAESEDDDCKICSLDIIHDFFYGETTTFTFSQVYEKLEAVCFISYTGVTTLLNQGRAPPVL